MKRLILLAAILPLMGMAAFAQKSEKAAIVFDKTVHNFGNVKRSGGQQSCTFEFTNSGSTPLIVQNVTTSCGCATPGWTKEPVASGAKGYVKAAYTPTALAGFDKSLTVHSNGLTEPVVLRITGTVVDSSMGKEE